MMIRSRKQHVYDRLRVLLEKGELAPGDRLTEIALSQKLRVSRGPLREAINKLVSEGLLEQSPGLGAYVCSPDQQEISDIYEVREALESFAAARAAERIEPWRARRLQEVCDKMRALLEEYRSKTAWDENHRIALLEADMEFHAVIAQVAGNARLEKLLEDYRLLQRMLAYSDRQGSISTLSTRAWAWGQHVRILRAIQSRNPQAARQAMARHVATARKNVVAAYTVLRSSAETEK